MGNKLKITLTVANASGLFALDNPSQATIESYCVLSDNNYGSSPNGGGIEQFQSTAELGQDVSWDGATSSQGYSVAISAIVYEPDVNNDVNIFDSGTLSGTNGRNGNVTAKVKNDESLKGKLDVYTIQFGIYQTPTLWKAYSIDPRLRIDS